MTASAHDDTISRIYALRREGKVLDACQMADNYCRTNPSYAGFEAFACCVTTLYNLPEIDKELYREWFSQITSYIIQNLNTLGGRDFIAAHLKGDDFDAYLARRLKFIRDALAPKTPEQKMAEEAVRLSKAGDLEQACALFDKALKSGARLEGHQQESYGWAIYKCLKIPDYPVNKAVPKLRAYLDLKDVKKPSALNSLILVTADRYLSGNDYYDYAGFLERFDLDTLSPEDFKPGSGKTDDGQNITYEPLYDKVLRHAAKVALARFKNQRKAAGLNCLMSRLGQLNDKALTTGGDEHRSDHEIWRIYYEAKLLGILKQDLGRAVKLALHVIRIKPQESWLWKLLFSLYELTGEFDKAVMCCCKAMLCNADTFSLKKSLIRLLLNSGDESTAACLLHKILAEVPSGFEDQDLKQWQGQSWYLNSGTLNDLSVFEEHKFYQAKASLADEIIFDFVPWTEAVLGPEVDAKDQKGWRTILAKIKFKDESEDADGLSVPFMLSAPAERFRGREEGEPVWVRILPVDPVSSDKLKICAVKKREGEPYDLMPAYTAVVYEVNSGQKLYRCIIKERLETVLSFDDTNRMLKAGAGIGLQLYSYYSKKTEGLRYKILRVQKPGLPLFKGVKRETHTVVRSLTSSKADITADETYIPSSLRQSLKLKPGDKVRVQAVKVFNPALNKYGYKAYKVMAEGRGQSGAQPAAPQAKSENKPKAPQSKTQPAQGKQPKSAKQGKAAVSPKQTKSKA